MTISHFHPLLAFAAISVLLSAARAADTHLAYPPTRRVDHVDTYFGTKVEDPYRWLEDDVRSSPEVAEWVKAENKLTESYLAAIPERETIRRRLTELWNFAQYSPYMKEGGRYFYLQERRPSKPACALRRRFAGGRAAGADRPQHLVQGRHDRPGRDGLQRRRQATWPIAAREAGSDWSIWHVMEIATGRQLPDELKWTKFSNASWTKDGKGFFYSRYEEPKPAPSSSR